MRPKAAYLMLSVLVGGLVAGCLTPRLPGDEGSPAAPLDWATRALPYLEPHNHSDPLQHVGFSTPNFQIVGWDPLPTERLDGKSTGGAFCGGATTRADGMRISVVSSYTPPVAFVVVDVTDPAKPTKIGEYVLEDTQVYDVDITPDGEHVVIAANLNRALPIPALPVSPPVALAAPETVLVQPKFRDACTGELRAAGPEQSLPGGPSTLLVSIKDPSNPTLEDAKPNAALNVHSVSTAEIDGKTWVLTSVLARRHYSAHYYFYTVERTQAGIRLDLKSVYEPPLEDAATAGKLNGHGDGTIAKHPITGQTLAYLANWNGGVLVLDLADARNPKLLTRWNDWKGPGFAGTGQFHGTYPLADVRAGKHYTLVGQEFSSRPPDRPTGWIVILDTTDPTHVHEISRWTLPVDVNFTANLAFSTHYTQVINDTMFVGMYHGGLWAVDIADVTTPRSVGVFIPDRIPEIEPVGSRMKFWPAILDIFAYPDGTLVTYDAWSGAYTLRFDATDPAPLLEEWPMEGKMPEPAS